MKIKVFIASPYTIGDVAVNVRTQIIAANKLIDLGFDPYVPLLSHFQHMMIPQPYEVWTELDIEWLKVSDCVLRLDGESKGADNEVRQAIKLGKPVFTTINNIIEFIILFYC